jgi:hypothetical protein
MKKIFLFVIASFLMLFLVAFDVLPGTEVPVWVVALLTAVAIPLLVELVKLLAAKVPWLSWISGKVALSVLTYIVSVGAVAIFVNWTLIPPLPTDPAELVSVVLAYATAFFGAATGLYNVLIARMLNSWATSTNVLAYKLQ